MPKSAKPTPGEPVKNPVAAGIVLLATGALVAAVLNGLARGLSSLK